MSYESSIKITERVLELAGLGKADFKDIAGGVMTKTKVEIDPPDALVTLGLVKDRTEAIDYLRDVADGWVLAVALGQLDPQRALPSAITFGFLLGMALARQPKTSAQ